MARTILVVLVGTEGGGQADAYQVLQQEAAREEARKAGLSAEVLLAPGFDHLRVVRKRLSDASAPAVDAVVVEPSSVASMGLLLKELKGKTGLVFLNAWSEEVDAHAGNWGRGLAFGTVSLDHAAIGRIQAQQVAALLPGGGHVLCITGPLRAPAAADRLAGLKAELPPGISLYESEAGKWMDTDGIVAFESWYSLYKTRDFAVDVIAAHSDELAVGARRACEAVPSAAHREILRRAPVLGVDACPAYGRKLVDSGQLRASVLTPATAADAVRGLQKFWQTGQPMALKALTQPAAYPPTSVRS
ncbi:MAG TPA: substrate-binding domain-containing protein [Vicinamibacteria bacterium]|nr:substrate-binding domain-containing protein [Vicinamibacteria bacterium]